MDKRIARNVQRVISPDSITFFGDILNGRMNFRVLDFNNLIHFTRLRIYNFGSIDPWRKIKRMIRISRIIRIIRYTRIRRGRLCYVLALRIPASKQESSDSPNSH